MIRAPWAGLDVPWVETPEKVHDTVTRAAAADMPFMPLTFRERVLTFPIVHDAAILLRYVGLRDRLRCLRCTGVGTFKPHGGFTDWVHDRIARNPGGRVARRWLCKYCGLYLSGREGRNWAFIDLDKGWWVLPAVPSDDDPNARVNGDTPLDMIVTAAGSRNGKPAVDPWRG